MLQLKSDGQINLVFVFCMSGEFHNGHPEAAIDGRLVAARRAAMAVVRTLGGSGGYEPVVNMNEWNERFPLGDPLLQLTGFGAVMVRRGTARVNLTDLPDAVQTEAKGRLSEIESVWLDTLRDRGAA